MLNEQEKEKSTEASESARNGSVVTVVEMHTSGSAETANKREAGDGSESKITSFSDSNSIEMKNMASPDDIKLGHLDDADSPAEKLSGSSDFEIVQKEADDYVYDPHNIYIEEKRNLIS